MHFEDSELRSVANGPLFFGNELGPAPELPSRDRDAPPVTPTLDLVYLTEPEVRVGQVSRCARGDMGKPLRHDSSYVNRVGTAP